MNQLLWGETTTIIFDPPVLGSLYLIHIFLIIIILAVAWVIRFVLETSFRITTQLEGDLVDIIVATSAIIGILAFLLWNLGRLSWVLFSIRATLSGEPMSEAITPFIQLKLENLDKDIKGILQKGGKNLDQEAVNSITEFCFIANRNGMYDGTDSHVPSKFMEKYPNYLFCQTKCLGIDINNRGTRILIVERYELRKDKRDNQVVYENFVKWHHDNGVILLQADPSEANDLAKERYGLPTPDVGIYHKKASALHFTSEEKTNSTTLAMLSRKNNGEDYGNTLNYFQALKKRFKDHTIPFEYSPELFDRNFSQNWEGFVGCQERKKEEDKFLLPRLEPFRNERIFDAAAGIGCESITLLQNGFDVTSNEIEDTLADIAAQKATEQGVRLFRTKFDWEELSKEYPKPLFKAVLVLGNSLCLLLDENDRKECLNNFASILKPNGIIIIDERNFRYILKDRQNITSDPINNFRYSRKIMYCEPAVKGVPTAITDEMVTFLYYKHNNDTVRTVNDAHNYKYKVGTLQMYPFKEGEMIEMLKNTGFEDITTYSDFETDFSENADFYTYVAVKK